MNHTMNHTIQNDTMAMNAGMEFYDVLRMVVSVLISGFMIFGGALPYVSQYYKIYRNKSAAGFSLYICLVLLLANILRVMFWWMKRFETILLFQSIVMILAMLVMLEISVRMNRKKPSERTSLIRGCHCFYSFWRWSDFSSYIVTLVSFTTISALITYLLQSFPVYVEGLGMASLLLESLLGLPQLVRNCKRESTEGMSTLMVLIWFAGDVGKAVYFVVNNTPIQFWICSFIQITIDVCIMIQVIWYWNNEDDGKLPDNV